MLIIGALLFTTSLCEPVARVITITPPDEPVATRAIVETVPFIVYDESYRDEPPQMPGWPKTIPSDPNFAPIRGATLADLDNDKKLEIIVPSTLGKLYAWKLDGTPYGNFPVTTIGFPQWAASVGDLDRDGKVEIVQTTRGWTSGGRLYVFDNTGKVLPGWPKSLNGNNVEYSAVLADLDKDSKLEIIVGERAYPIGRIHVFEKDGTEWGGNWPVTIDHVPAQSAAVGDVDGDGNKEVFYTSYVSMYLIRKDGTIMPGWPKQIPNANFSYQSAALADLDGDKKLEIIVGAHGNAPGFYVYRYDGSAFSGWPKFADTWTYCPPTVTDMERNGILDIAGGQAGYFSGNSRCFWIWDRFGQVRNGFPYYSSHGGGSDGPLTVADIEGNGLHEIFADHNVTIGGNGFLFGVTEAGGDIVNFPLRPTGFTYMNSATIGDVDGNGTYELAVVAFAENVVNVYLYTLPWTYKRKTGMEWPTYHVRNTRDGVFGVVKP
ncbi:MAG TPA: VCBS repeat-containing protein [Fimbriimonadales bacterium]|nr:VCBS repeat-containing protein [Fimbriimonadales bacterium]